MSAWHRYFDADVPVARLRLFSTVFLLLLAFDACFVMSWRGFAYGEAGFNVAHFAWLDAIQPLPSSASYIGLLLLAGIVAVVMALAGVSRWRAITLCGLFSYGWMQSQLDTYQHHYFISLILFCLIFFPKVDRTVPASRRVAGRGYALLGTTVAVLYFFTAIAKMDAVWLRGDTMRRIDRVHGNLAPLEEFFAGLGVGPDAFWSVLATQVIPLELFMSGAYLFAVATRGHSDSRTRNLCWLALVAAVGLHGGIEFFGLKIGMFSYYMLLLAFVFFLPTRVVVAVAGAVRWPVDALLAAVGSFVSGRAGILGLSGVAAVLLLGVGLAADLPGSFGACGLAAAGVVVAGGLAAGRNRGSKPSDPIFAAGVAAVLLLWGLSLSHVRFEFYGYRGTWLTRSGDVAGGLAAFEKARRYAPPDVLLNEQLQPVRDLPRKDVAPPQKSSERLQQTP
ncbi:MAG: hypothetical protein E2O66_09130 [Deltaproteobacteria bacterium]|nr:MAG: hypothetical protein E2O66_09130 [Deltaproteobacteria bacterium]